MSKIHGREKNMSRSEANVSRNLMSPSSRETKSSDNRLESGVAQNGKRIPSIFETVFLSPKIKREYEYSPKAKPPP